MFVSPGWTLCSQPWGSDAWGRDGGILHLPALSWHSDAEISPLFIRLAGKLGANTSLTACRENTKKKNFLTQKVPPLSAPRGCFLSRKEYGLFQQAGSPHFGESPLRLAHRLMGSLLHKLWMIGDFLNEARTQECKNQMLSSENGKMKRFEFSTLFFWFLLPFAEPQTLTCLGRLCNKLCRREMPFPSWGECVSSPFGLAAAHHRGLVACAPPALPGEH